MQCMLSLDYLILFVLSCLLSIFTELPYRQAFLLFLLTI